MARKTHHVEELGIRVEGHTTITEARKAWAAKRDQWCDISTGCRPWVFAFRGFTCVVAPCPSGSWEYTIVTPDHAGMRSPSCYYGAESQIAAIAKAVGSLAQRMWTRDIPDDAAFFNELITAARITAHEARNECSNFLHVTAYWRAHPIAA